MTTLAEKACRPCRKGDQPLSAEQTAAYLESLPGWDVVERENIPRLEKSFPFPDFRTALDFTNRVGELAEEEHHHPAVLLSWGRAAVSWWTHEIEGLHENDFILAARTDRLFRGQAESSKEEAG